MRSIVETRGIKKERSRETKASRKELDTTGKKENFFSSSCFTPIVKVFEDVAFHPLSVRLSKSSRHRSKTARSADRLLRFLVVS